MYLKTWQYKLSKKNHIQYIEKRLKNIKKSNKSVNKDLKTKNGQKKLLNTIFEEIIVKKNSKFNKDYYFTDSRC